MSENRLLSKLASADEVPGADGAQQLSVHKVLEGASTGATPQNRWPGGHELDCHRQPEGRDERERASQFAAEVEFQNKSKKPTNRERLHALLDLLGYLYMISGKPERACEYLRLLVSLRPGNSRLLRSLAHSELESGNAEAARELLERTLPMHMNGKDRAATFLLLSRALLRLQRVEDAAKAIGEFMNEKRLAL